MPTQFNPEVAVSEDDPEYLLLPVEVGAIFRVGSKTVTRWVKAGRFFADEIVKTGGGHIRIKRRAVDRLLNIAADAAA
jgi:hypothetical protein